MLTVLRIAYLFGGYCICKGKHKNRFSLYIIDSFLSLWIQIADVYQVFISMKAIHE